MQDWDLFTRADMGFAWALGFAFGVLVGLSVQFVGRF